MLLKRIYDPGTKGLSYVAIRHTGTSPDQNFSTKMIYEGTLQGWISLHEDRIVLHTKPEELVYKINLMPGRYCCHCGDKLPDDETGQLARMHVEARHKGKKSPDAQCPAGYTKVNAYLCTLNSELHEKYKFRAVAGPKKVALPSFDIASVHGKKGGQ